MSAVPEGLAHLLGRVGQGCVYLYIRGRFISKEILNEIHNLPTTYHRLGEVCKEFFKTFFVFFPLWAVRFVRQHFIDEQISLNARKHFTQDLEDKREQREKGPGVVNG